MKWFARLALALLACIPLTMYAYGSYLNYQMLAGDLYLREMEAWQVMLMFISFLVNIIVIALLGLGCIIVSFSVVEWLWEKAK